MPNLIGGFLGALLLYAVISWLMNKWTEWT